LTSLTSREQEKSTDISLHVVEGGGPLLCEGERKGEFGQSTNVQKEGVKERPDPPIIGKCRQLYLGKRQKRKRGGICQESRGGRRKRDADPGKRYKNVRTVGGLQEEGRSSTRAGDGEESGICLIFQ